MKNTRILAGFALALAAGAVSAHPGHEAISFAGGLAHPFGLDHLLAMVAVGAWSAAALKGARAAWGPLAFVGAMLFGAFAGASGFWLPGVESAIAITVVAFGAMLVFVTALPAAPGLALVVAAGLLHGLAHGAEMPLGGSFAPYSAGFVLTTALLHAGGLALGRLRLAALQVAGALIGGAGFVLLTQV